MATTRVRISEALDDFIAEQEYKGNRPATTYYYRSNLDRFMTGTGAVFLDELDEARVRAWVLSHGKLSPNTIATYDRSLRVFTGWLHRRGYLATNPLANLPKPRGKSMEVVTFTHDEVRAMIAEAVKGHLDSRSWGTSSFPRVTWLIAWLPELRVLGA